MKIRPANIEDASALARVHIDTWRTAYRGIMPDDILDKLDYKKSTDRWHSTLSTSADNTCAFVAEADDGQIVGFVTGGPNKEHNTNYDAEVYALYVLQEYQGIGIGKALFVRAANWLVENKYKSLIVWLLKENPAKGFYKVIGGKQMGSKTTKIGNAVIDGISYGWTDITTILTS